jgi:hypothetical protein
MRLISAIKYIAPPLFIGLSVGLTAGAFGLIASGLLGFELTGQQKQVAFWGFIACFGTMGLIDSTQRLVHLLRQRAAGKRLKKKVD